MEFDSFLNVSSDGSLMSKILFFERVFDGETIRQFSEDIRSLSVFSSLIYVVLIFAGKRYMKHRQAFDLRVPLIVWNSMLTLFSVIGAIRTIPEMYDSLTQHGWAHSVCNTRYFYGTTGFWAYAFTASKIVELGDTAFVVLRRQPLIFLHWYHHVTVLIYCFYSFPQHVASGRWYMVMNYCIHSIMYGYFTLRALRFRLPHVVRVTVTSLQIVQMMIGLGVVISAYFLKSGGTPCHQSYTNMVVTIGMYLSYLLLFLYFFYEEYAMPSKKDRSKASVNDKAKSQ